MLCPPFGSDEVKRFRNVYKKVKPIRAVANICAETTPGVAKAGHPRTRRRYTRVWRFYIQSLRACVFFVIVVCLLPLPVNI